MALSNTYEPNAPANPYPGAGSAVGNREDLEQGFYMVEPENTPLFSLAAKGDAKSTFIEWGVDNLAAPSTTGVAEGADVSTFVDKFASSARLGNYITKYQKPYKVSDLQEAADSATPADLARAEAKAMLEVKRDVEATIASDNDRTIEDGAGTPYGMRGLGDWLDSAGPADVPADYRTPAGSIYSGAIGSFDETALNDIVASIFTETGEVDNLTLVAGTALRKQISEFTRAEGTTTDRSYQVTQNATTKTVTLAVDVFDSDFGLVNIVNGNPACMPNARRGYIFNPKFLGCKSLIPMGSTRLENQGGGERGYVDTALTLCVKNPLAFGKIDATA